MRAGFGFGPNSEFVYHVALKGGPGDGHMTNTPRMQEPPWKRMWVTLNLKSDDTDELRAWPYLRAGTARYNLEGIEERYYFIKAKRSNVLVPTAVYSHGDVGVDDDQAERETEREMVLT